MPLSDDERRLADQLRQSLAAIKARLLAHDSLEPGALENMGRLAHELHMSLKKSGHEPKHTKIMVRNRDLKPTDAEFYVHVHPVEDLLGFLENECANNDPVDLTIDKEFEFPVFSRRLKHKDTYRIKRTASGWTFTHMQELETGPDARVGGKSGSGLFQLLDHDSINYPEDLPGYFEWLWEQARDRGLEPDEVQAAITDLADWVTVCEKRSPAGIFEGFK